MLRRTVDILFAQLWLILSLPIMLMIAILIKLESPGPIFYRQQMVGWKGRVFSLLRFRTMNIDAANREAQFTRVGSFIRKYSLDHLPQLLNLLKGDITLIGPRPMEVAVVNLQDDIWQQYVKSKPGLFNYAIYKLGKKWVPSRLSDPRLNQELELQYGQRRSAKSDMQLFLGFLQKFVTSKGNIKARGKVDPEFGPNKDS